MSEATREAVSPRASIDGLGNYTSGSVEKPRIFPLGDMTKAWNDHKLGVLTDLPASSTGATILAIEAIVVATHPHEGNSSVELPACLNRRRHRDPMVASEAMPVPQME